MMILKYQILQQMKIVSHLVIYTVLALERNIMLHKWGVD